MDQQIRDTDAIEVQEAALPREGFVRLATVLAVIPVSVAAWYKYQAQGLVPRPVSIPGTQAKLYDVAEIRALMERIRSGGAA